MIYKRTHIHTHTKKKFTWVLCNICRHDHYSYVNFFCTCMQLITYTVCLAGAGDCPLNQPVHKDPLLHVLPEVEPHGGRIQQIKDLLVVDLQEGAAAQELKAISMLIGGKKVLRYVMYSCCS